MEVPQNLKTELSYDLAIPLLDIHPEKMKTLIQKDTCTSVFTALSFTIAKIQKQHNCSSTHGWVVEALQDIKVHRVL